MTYFKLALLLLQIAQYFIRRSQEQGIRVDQVEKTVNDLNVEIQRLLVLIADARASIDSGQLPELKDDPNRRD